MVDLDGGLLSSPPPPLLSMSFLSQWRPRPEECVIQPTPSLQSFKSITPKLVVVGWTLLLSFLFRRSSPLKIFMLQDLKLQDLKLQDFKLQYLKLQDLKL